MNTSFICGENCLLLRRWQVTEKRRAKRWLQEAKKTCSLLEKQKIKEWRCLDYNGLKKNLSRHTQRSKERSDYHRSFMTFTMYENVYSSERRTALLKRGTGSRLLQLLLLNHHLHFVVKKFYRSMTFRTEHPSRIPFIWSTRSTQTGNSRYTRGCVHANRRSYRKLIKRGTRIF